jgi:hypothetical protein
MRARQTSRLLILNLTSTAVGLVNTYANLEQASAYYDARDLPLTWMWSPLRERRTHG